MLVQLGQVDTAAFVVTISPKEQVDLLEIFNLYVLLILVTKSLDIGYQVA